MFIGHWAPALAVAAKRPAPTLGVLMIAGQLIDWAFFSFHLAGIEHMRFTPGISAMNPMDLYHMPYSHSLAGAAGFGLALAACVWLAIRDRTAALLAAAVVVSHWFIDLLVHVPDLTLAGSPPKLGLGLWNHPAIEMPLELGITFGALWLYARHRRPMPVRLWTFAALLLALQAFNWFVPPPPEATPSNSVMAIAAYGLVTLVAVWMGKSARAPA
ncbi:hypothetical protein B0I00_0417 [Novosphingobium kunmingense]|uniref:Uncharacterized protein n=1 Tax=Novosphingobium kunmingense TaxID=1211806 RepID=A0A2N0I213_9SPHN|nr:hypothetical protein [Novosphingobium kunmingense]PKB25224.1 hypothetical protein B0I00_0417 [Novosphingobium kunmingense]